MSAHDLYTERILARRADVKRLTDREKRISLGRIAAAFAAFGALFWIPIVALLPAVWFVILVIAHERSIRERKRAERALAWYEEGEHRILGTWAGRGVSGDAYVQPHHLYASDLDLFGRGSLFELLCTARTRDGRALLASWLNQPATSVEEIRSRQEAVAELTPLDDFREELASAGAEVSADLDLAGLRAWSAAPRLLVSSVERWIALLLGGVGIVTFAITLPSLLARLAGWTHPESAARLGAIGQIPIWPFLLVVAAQVAFAFRIGPRVGEVVHGVERAEESLALLARVVGVVERQTFASPRLVAVSDLLRKSGVTASEEVERLHKLVALLDSKRNQFFAPFAALMLWSTNIAFSLEAWRARAGKDIGRWIDGVAEAEALASFGTFSFEQPDLSVPAIVDGPARFQASSLGHPLIPAARRVTNDVAFGDGLSLLLVSGSNMSGKSTLMRSVGVSTVMALAGAPVCAKTLTVTPMAIGASIRIGDSLQEGASKFYAEILRIRDILNAAATGPLLFLLDEVLAGTNSHDRRLGAEAIIKALVDRGAIGLVSTHDLVLARVADSLETRAKNVHFEDHLDDGKVVFDYRMRDGVVQKSNAVELMRSVGIEV
jgi:hypothetical protein